MNNDNNDNDNDNDNKITSSSSSKINESAGTVTGNLVLTIIDSLSGETRDILNLKNLVVNTGKEYIAACLAYGENERKVDHIALGLSNKNPMKSDTRLDGEIAREAIQSVEHEPGTSSVTYRVFFPPGVATGSISEAGIIRSSEKEEESDSPVIMTLLPRNETLLSRTVFPMVLKREIDSVTIEWTITIN